MTSLLNNSQSRAAIKTGTESLPPSPGLSLKSPLKGSAISMKHARVVFIPGTEKGI